MCLSKTAHSIWAYAFYFTLPWVETSIDDGRAIIPNIQLVSQFWRDRALFQGRNARSWRIEVLIEEVFNTEDHSITRPPLCGVIGFMVHYALFYGRIQSRRPAPRSSPSITSNQVRQSRDEVSWNILVCLESFQLPRLWDVDQTKSLSLNCSRSFDTFDNTPSSTSYVSSDETASTGICSRTAP